MRPYHSSATARDRDKVRQAVLEGLGWTILRVWSTDWFRDPAGVTERVHTELERLLEEDREVRAAAAADADAKDEDDGRPTAEVPAGVPNEASVVVQHMIPIPDFDIPDARTGTEAGSHTDRPPVIADSGVHSVSVPMDDSKQVSGDGEPAISARCGRTGWARSSSECSVCPRRC